MENRSVEFSERWNELQELSDMRRTEEGNEMSALTLKQLSVKTGAMAEAARAMRPRRLTKIYTYGAAVGLFGSAAVSLFGSILTGASWFAGNDGARRWLSVTGAVLLFLTIPLLILAAICLDALEKIKSGIGSKGMRAAAAEDGYEEDDDQ